MTGAEEVWKAVPGYGGAYEVSSHGRVRSLDRLVLRSFRDGRVGARLVAGRVLRPGPARTGHRTVALGRGNSKQVHSLVLLAFVGPPPPGHEVLHNDGDPANNRLSNLRYGTRSENNFDITRHGRRALTRDQVLYVRKRSAEGFAYGELHQLARSWGVNPGILWRVKNGNSYTRVA
jgi:hypothetical protein